MMKLNKLESFGLSARARGLFQGRSRLAGMSNLTAGDTIAITANSEAMAFGTAYGTVFDSSGGQTVTVTSSRGSGCTCSGSLTSGQSTPE